MADTRMECITRNDDMIELWCIFEKTNAQEWAVEHPSIMDWIEVFMRYQHAFVCDICHATQTRMR